jgi:predicted secreted protein
MTYRSWLALFLTASLSATAFAGCASDEATPADDTAATTDDSEDELKALIITDKDNKKTFNVKYGQTVTVKLTSNASTGYEWKILATDKSFGYPSSTVVSPGTAVGGAGYTKLVWKTNNPFAVGQHTVTLGYQRADATADAKIKTFTFTVIVADKSTDAGAAEGKSCGGYANTPCAAGLRCEFGTTPAGAAGSLTGVCKKPPVSECVVGGCSGQLCVEDSAGGGISTCEWKDEYACYKAATCARQKDGACGWTASTALDACLAGGGTGAPGAFCGGIGNIQCPAGQTCQIEATHPDAGGTCILAGETLGKPCGAIRSIGFVACNAGEFCSYTLANICGRADATGTCAVQPTSCPVGCPAPANQPCGCDGQKYCNECEANKAGVSIVACE